MVGDGSVDGLLGVAVIQGDEHLDRFEAVGLSLMQHKAGISSNYRRRLLIVGVVFLGGGAWFFYDGFVGYPKANILLTEKLDAYQRLVVEQEKPDQWDQLAVEKSWWNPEHDLDNPEHAPKPKGHLKQPNDLLAQKILGAICSVIGLGFSWMWCACAGRWVELVDGRLRNNKGREVALGDIQSLDSSRWHKGIAWVRYKTADGADDAILLDDWKYELEPTREIYKIIHAQTEPQVPSSESEDQESGEQESGEQESGGQESGGQEL